MADEAEVKETVEEGDELSEEKVTEQLAELTKAKATQEEGEVPETEEGEAELTDEEKTAKIEGLQKELKRVRQKVRDDNSSEVQGLREEIAELRGQVKGKDSGERTLDDLSEDELIQLKAQWNVYQNKKIAEQNEEEVGKSARNLARIDKRLQVMAREGAVTASDQQTLATQAGEALEGVYEDAKKTIPDMFDEDTPLFQAAQKEIRRPDRKALYQGLGPFDEIIAAAFTIINNPELVVGKGKTKVEKEARRELVDNIETATKKALKAGVSSGDKGKVSTTFDNASEAEVDAAMDKLKATGSLSV